MRKSIYYAEGCTDTYYNYATNTLVSRWYNLTTRVHIRSSLEAKLELLEKRRPETVIADLSGAVGMPYPDDQAWFGTHLWPLVRRAGVDSIIVIFPKNYLARVAVRSWLDKARQQDVDVTEVNSMEEACEYLGRIRLPGEKRKVG